MSKFSFETIYNLMKENDNIVDDKYLSDYHAEYMSQTPGAKNTLYDGISSDSREIKSKQVFIALKGTNGDGHNYVSQAIRSADSIAITEKVLTHIPYYKQIVVNNCHKALKILAQNCLDNFKGKKIVITGSAGKTTAKEMIAHILKNMKKKVSYPVKSYNTLTEGIPITIINANLSDDFWVLEAGMGEKGKIDQIGNFLKPEISIITSIQPSHIANFKNLDEIAEEKASIIPHTSELCIFPSNEYADLFKSKTKIKYITFGEKDSDEGQLLSHTWHDKNAKVQIRVENQTYDFFLPFPSKQIALSALAALLTCHTQGLDVKKCLQKLTSFNNQDGRGDIKEISVDGKRIRIMDDSYNCNPVAVRNSIQSFKNMSARYKILVLGQMNELGSHSEKEHSSLYDDISEFKCIFLLGERFKSLYDKLTENKPFDTYIYHCSSITELNKSIFNHIKNMPDDSLILIKGSRHGNYLEKTVNMLITL